MCQVGEGLAVREVGAPPPDRGQITGTVLRLLGAAAARPQLPSRASAELSSPFAHVESRGPTGAGARAVAWEGDVTCPSQVGGHPGPGPTVRRVRGDVMRIMNGPRAGPSRWGALRSVVQPGEAACGPGAVERGSMR